MKYDDFIFYIKNPDSISEKNQAEFLELSNAYPFFSLAKWMYLKSLQASGSVYFEQELKKTALYAKDRRCLYYFMHTDIQKENEQEHLRSEGTGSYFDMIEKLEKKDENRKTTLSSLAEKLRLAREMLQTEAEAEEAASKEVEKIPEIDFEAREEEAKNLIREKNYVKAIEILEELNLINPKKSIYFADQIRFLRKIIENS